MRAIKIGIAAIACGLLSFTMLWAQEPASLGPKSNLSALASTRLQSHRPTGAMIRERLLQQKTGSASSDNAATSAQDLVPCNGPTGARFNLEPRNNAVPQTATSTDFILNGAGLDSDLIVEMADDTRGLDNSGSAYYVHRSSTADCSLQFEGGLPPFQFQGDTFVGTNAQGGGPHVVADSARGAFFATDGRTGNQHAGIGLFRAAAADLLNPARCPNGTHSLAQATACWTQTAPVFLDPLPAFDEAGRPFLAVDERATGSGTGAGDVYVLYFNSGGQTTLSIVACTNSLQCGTAAQIPMPANAFSLPGADVHVLPTGGITVSFALVPQQRSTGATVFFATCTPAGAPNPPTCAQPTLVATVANRVVSTSPGPDGGYPLTGIGFELESTFPRHANRPGPGNDFSSFVVYDDCRNLFTDSFGTVSCLAGEVNLTFSTDSGKTWSTPVSIDRKPGHHFFANVAADVSTGTISIVYLSTEGDPNFHQTRVLLNQIALGSTQVSPARFITTALDAGETSAPVFQFIDIQDEGIGVASRGTGALGHSRLYTSFNSSSVPGFYGKEPLLDLNNHIDLQLF